MVQKQQKFADLIKDNTNSGFWYEELKGTF